MAESTFVTPSTELARALVEALVASGVREVVLCPGSRSSPMAYAVAQAERTGRLRLHVRVDERTAGFLALGLAKVSRRPAVVITTSGTAVANLHPAVLEAHHALVPFLVLSCDRPAELRGTGANQTTIQPGIFGGVVRDEADLTPETDLMDVVGHVWDAVAAARGVDPQVAAGSLSLSAPGEVFGQGPVRELDGRLVFHDLQDARPGPVHLNVQFREPLVPLLDDPPLSLGDGPSTPWESSRGSHRDVGSSLGDGFSTPWESSRGSHPELGGGPPPGEGPSSGVTLPVRTLVVLGDVPSLDHARTVLNWAADRGLPVLAEPFGPHPRPGAIRHGVLVAGVPDSLEAQAPEAIVVVGRPTLSRPVNALLRRLDTRLVLVDTGLEFAPSGRAAERLSLAELVRATVSADVHAREEWSHRWQDAGRAVAEAIDADPPAWPTGPALARAVIDALPSGATLFLGSSNSPRDLEVAATPERALDVVASRGLAGIDGCVSTAIGIALSTPGDDRGGGTYALMGDLTFLHDSNGLLIGPTEPLPDLTIVVANDDGGGIFTTLEPGEPGRAEDFERLFGTPTGTELGALCRAHGIRHELARTPAQLASALATRPNGLRVVEVPLDRATHRDERARLAALAVAALA